MATERCPIKVPCENEESPEKENATDFDEDTLATRADVYRNQGNEAFKKGDFLNAIHFYTEGIKVNCNEKELKAKLYNNRATAHFKLGNHQDTLRDAKAATELYPTYFKAIVRGATACVKLKRFEEAITWCDKGLAIANNNGILLSLRLQSVREGGDKSMEDKDDVSHDHAGASLGDVKKVIDYYNQLAKIAKERGDILIEGRIYGELGNVFLSVGEFRTAIKYYSLFLDIVKDTGDIPIKGEAYSSLGNAHKSLGDFNKAIEYHNLHLKIAKEVGDKEGEYEAYNELGIAYHNIGYFKKASEYQNLSLIIAKEIGDKHEEGACYSNLSITCRSLGDLERAIEYQNLHLAIATKEGDKHGEGVGYSNLGNAFQSLGDFKKAIEYHSLHLKITKEEGSRLGEGAAYANLGNAHVGLGDFKKAIEYHRLHLKIAKEVRDKCWEGKAYCNLGNAYRGLSDFKKAIEYQNLNLIIAKEIGDKNGEGGAYGNLGNAYQGLGDFRKALEYHHLNLKTAKEIGDKRGEGCSYCNLGWTYKKLGDFKKAIECLNLHLEIAKEVGDKDGERIGYSHLGSVYHDLGDFKKSIEYHSLTLEIAKEVGDKVGKGKAYGNLGSAYQKLGNFKKALEYHNLDLKIAKEVGDRWGEGNVYCNLGNAYQSLGDLKKGVECHNLYLKMAREVGDKHGEGQACGNLGNSYFSLGDITKAKELYNLQLKIAKEIEDKSLEAYAYYSLACVFRSLRQLPKAVKHFQASITLLNALRILLKSKDEWKVNFRNQYQMVYTGLWTVLVKQGKIDEALIVAEKGRAQALTDLMESSFCGGTSQPMRDDEDLVLKNVPSNTVFQAVDGDYVNLWVVSEGKQVQLRQSKLKGSVSENNGASQSFASFVLGIYTQLGVRSNVSCENRSLDALRECRSEKVEKSRENTPQPPVEDNKCLSTLYDIIMKPVADLVERDELLIVPDGPLWLAPYAAFKDDNSKYMCESFRIRLAPSLTSLRLIADCPEDYHKNSGALLVGDPWVTDISWVDSKGKRIFEQLPCAKKEVEMIGKILNIAPLTGRQATKGEVLKGLSRVALVHFAAHGSMDTGEIALTPDPMKAPSKLTKEDFILTIGEVLDSQLRAKLVVLSCCHSAQGEIKAEGVVGIARAFMGAGARSVVVSLWAIDDKATLAFMECFYHHLAEGKHASESLNLAMKSLRESDKFSDVKHWAPFMLIGDDVTLDLGAKEEEN